jgi:hypothetical protein
LDCEALLGEAHRLLASGLQTAAADILLEYLSANEAEPAVLQMLARVWMLQGRPADAVPLLKQALKLHRDRSQRGSCPRPASLPVASLDPEPAASVCGSETDEDWELIVHTAAERRRRRRFFNPADEPFQLPKGSELHAQPQPLTSGAATESSFQPLADPAAPSGTPSFGHAQLALALNGATQRLRRRPQPSNANQEAKAGGIRADQIQRRFDFDFHDDAAEDEAQRHFEEMLDASLETESLGEEAEGDVLDVEALEPEPDFSGSQELFGLDWDEFAFDADDFDEAPTREELVAVQSEGHLTRLERARQQAVNLGLEFGWDEDGIDVLTEVFNRYWWSQCKESMRRELQAGLRPDELRLALDIREIWSNHAQFAMDFSRLNGLTLLETTSAVYRNLSWPLALALVRSTDGYPDVDYIERLLCDLFDEWYTHSHLRRRCKSFNLFLFFRLGLASQELQLWPQWTFEPEEFLGLEMDDDHRPGVCTPEYQALNLLGLIPKVSVTPPNRAKPQDPHIPPCRPTEKRTGTQGSEDEPRSCVAFDGNRIASTAGAAPRRNQVPETRAGIIRRVAEADS